MSCMGAGGGLYVVKSVRVFLGNLDIVAAELIKVLLPLVAAVVVGAVGLIVSFLFMLVSPPAFAALVLLTVVAAVIVYVVSAAVAVGGFVLFALEAVQGVKSGIIEPFRKAWRAKGRVLLIMVVLAVIYGIVAAVLLAPSVAGILRLLSSIQGARSALQVAGLLRMLAKNLIVLMVVMVLMRLFFEPSYIFPFTSWRGALSSVSGSLGKVLSFVSDDPLSFIAFFLLFLFPEVLNYLWLDIIIENPLYSNLISLVSFLKTLIVDPLYILALLVYLKDRGDPDVNISGEFLTPRQPPQRANQQVYGSPVAEGRGFEEKS